MAWDLPYALEHDPRLGGAGAQRSTNVERANLSRLKFDRDNQDTKTSHGLPIIESCLTCPFPKDGRFCDLSQSLLATLDDLSLPACLIVDYRPARLIEDCIC